MISSEILEKQPDTFLENIQKPENKEEVAKWVNDTSNYNTWYSPGLTTLLYIVGDLKEDLKFKKFFYGCDTTTIGEDMGIKIFDILIQSNPDLELKNYCSETFKEKVLEIEKGEGLRKNNTKFMNHIKETLKW
jgi:hypothetical protein